ncbi:MAG TPA: FtsX-like permease family protein [Stellaceae bacterium]|nr:FtsX-like permease family protein [Stellaceae bacterium]
MSAPGLAIPFGRDGSSRFLPALTLLMVFLAGLALAAVMDLERALARWDASLTGTLTVELPAPTAPNDKSLDAALAVLHAAPGIKSATPIDRDATAKLIEPWLGAALSPADLELPRLIDVRLDPGGRADLAALRAQLAKASPGATLDDHQLWLDSLARFARSAELTAIAILVLIGGVAVVSVSFATRTGLAVHRDTIELLHLMGARDSYVARQFERQALRLALIGGAAGLVLAAAALLALSQAASAAAFLGDSVTLLPALHLRGWNWAVLAVLPIVAGLVAMATARLTVLTTLRRLP